MHEKNLATLIIIMICCFTTSCATRKTSTITGQTGSAPKREFRGAWIQTAFQEEYASKPVSELRKDFVRKLNQLQVCGINAIIFQVRPEADAFYRSDIEPWSRFYTGTQGKAPEGNFDVMAFLIEECHKHGMEFHAWLNPYRAGISGPDVFTEDHIYYKNPEWFVTYNKQVLFDPGVPDSRAYICRVVRDIVMRYDVDAIHMDDYFYPYPVAGLPFPDDESFRRYGKTKGYSDNRRDDWRRENVNLLISDLRRTILLAKPWVRFGISPFGIYRNKKNTPDGSGSETNGLQNYDDLYADVLHWIRQGWIDYTMPQIYWEIGHTAADYVTLIQWWDKEAGESHLYIGQDVARTMKAGQLTEKMKYERNLPQVQGNCFWPANEILWNNGGIADSLKNHYHRYPALIPPYVHQHDRSPKEVKKLKAEWTPDGYVLHWQAEQSPLNPETARYFVVYRFGKQEPVDINKAENIITVTTNPFYLLPYERGRESYRYVITTVDRFHNESKKGKTKKIKL
ncbi:MAG: family 10 glycosylhydrolase [Tannerellaceae bacterium]|nr:family 10 glycosylhydrolase [Tannerellaceae bacterium]